MADHPLLKDCIAKMQKNLDHTIHELGGINTGECIWQTVLLE